MTEERQGFWARLWKQPRSKWLLGIPLGGLLALVIGGFAFLGIQTTLHATSSTEFCYACHSHEKFVKPEYEASSHFKNEYGVRAECADCHLPHGFFDLAIKKMIVSKDIIPEMMGTISTQEKFEANRMHMAEKTWREMLGNESAYCKHCHSVEAMDFEAQGRTAGRRHETMDERGQTCINCHYGIVHKLPEGAAERIKEIDAEMKGESESGAE